MNATLWFLNLETRETRSIQAHLVQYWCSIEGDTCYQLRLANDSPAAEDALTPQQAIANGAWANIPETQWGWTDICRWGALPKPPVLLPSGRYMP